MKGKEVIELVLVSLFVLWLNDGHWFGYALVLLLFAVTFACVLSAPVHARKERELELAEKTLALRKTEMEQAARAAARAARLQEIEAKQAYWAPLESAPINA